MAPRKIIALPNQILRRKAHVVTHFTEDLQQLVDDMIETMRQAPGVGLAAPQVGISERVIVVEYPKDDTKEDSPKKLYVVINPEVKEISADTETAVEACLSIPNLHGEVERSLGISIKGLTRHGQPIRIKARDWLARIFQHEIDHLDGIVFTDRAKRVWRPAPDEQMLDNV
jgi:peptide deformylase